MNALLPAVVFDEIDTPGQMIDILDNEVSAKRVVFDRAMSVPGFAEYVAGEMTLEEYQELSAEDMIDMLYEWNGDYHLTKTLLGVPKPKFAGLAYDHYDNQFGTKIMVGYTRKEVEDQLIKHADSLYGFDEWKEAHPDEDWSDYATVAKEVVNWSDGQYSITIEEVE
jgi:hypothetical protein